MTRVEILGRNRYLTPFDLRAQTFRVNVNMSTYYRRYTRKTIFEPKVYFRTFDESFYISTESVQQQNLKNKNIVNYYKNVSLTIARFSVTIPWHVVYAVLGKGQGVLILEGMFEEQLFEGDTIEYF